MLVLQRSESERETDLSELNISMIHSVSSQTLQSDQNGLFHMKSDDLDDLISSMRLKPVVKIFSSAATIDPSNEIRVRMSFALSERIKMMSKIPITRLEDTSTAAAYPSFFIPLDEKFCKAMLDSGLLIQRISPFQDSYLLAVNSDGGLKIRNQNFSDGHDLPTLSVEQIERIVNTGVKLLLERDLDYAPVFLAERARKMCSLYVGYVRTGASTAIGKPSSALGDTEVAHRTCPPLQYVSLQEMIAVSSCVLNLSTSLPHMEFPFHVPQPELVQDAFDSHPAVPAQNTLLSCAGNGNGNCAGTKLKAAGPRP